MFGQTTALNSRQCSTWLALVSTGVFIFYALTFAMPSGYSYGAGILLLASLAYLTTRPQCNLSGEDKTLAYLLLAAFLAPLIVVTIHGDRLKMLDQSSRYLLLIPILLLLLKTPPRLPALWAGLGVGAVSTAVIALWQYYRLGVERPDGFMTSAIPFGGISLMAGMLCLAGLRWTAGQRHGMRLWRFFLAIGFLAGLYASILSSSRGGWLALPAVLPIFCIAFVNKRNLKQAAMSTFLLIAAIGIVLGILRNQITARVELAVTEVNSYIQHDTSNSSVGLRLEAWRAATMSIAERPLLGWSYKDYTARLEELAAEKKTSESITELSNTHNNYLEVWLHQGIFGLLAFLAMFIVPFWFFCKRLRSPNIKVQALAVGGASLLVSFFIFGLTQVILGRNNGVIFFGLSLVIFWACMRNEEKRVASEQLSNTPVSQQ